MGLVKSLIKWDNPDLPVKKSGIYKIVCLTNLKIYIGSASNLKKRWRDHQRMMENGIHHSRHLQSTYNNLGAKVFVFEIVEFCQPSILVEREQFWIDFFQSWKDCVGYNICPTAGNTFGRTHTEEAKAKMSACAAGRKHTTESKLRMSISRKGRIVSQETRNKLALLASERTHSEITKAKMRGRHVSEETRRKIGEASKRKPVSENQRRAVSLANAARTVSEETRRKISESLKGRKHSEETKRKISESARTRNRKRL